MTICGWTSSGTKLDMIDAMSWSNRSIYMWLTRWNGRR